MSAEAGGPAFCEVSGVLTPAPGSRIGVVFRLPLDWNGKLLGLGGGGWAGDVRLESALPALRRGYAVLQTDAGHPSPNGIDAGWAVLSPGQANTPGLADFSWRAVHETAVNGKRVAAAFYGRPHARAYFQGCSTGGRMGLMEAQRFPEDYDGIVAGAPVYDLTVQTSALMRTQFFHKDPESNLTPAQLPLVNRAVLASCDRLDGLADGIVADPRACRWDPGALQCRPGAAAGTCLTARQVATVRNAYRGYTTRAGQVAAWPLMRGGELDWLGRSVGNPQAPLGSNALTGARGIQFLVYADPGYDLNRWDPEKDLASVRTSALAPVYEAGNPDLRPFARRGGKLILWHGGYDPGPSPLATIAYFDAARRRLGPAADRSVRLFLVPGVYHCAGGPGPDQFDMLGALDTWVETGTAPAAVVASRADQALSRPLCPYPEQARYVGGPPMLAASFRCRR
jgi:feruloyl esterase